MFLSQALVLYRTLFLTFVNEAEQSSVPVILHRTEHFCALGPVQTREEQLQEKRVEKMMRAAAKDVHKIRGQSRKEVPEVQTFRWEKQQARFQLEVDRETQL